MEILNLTITDLSRSGSGVAREASGRVVFVPFTAPGDQVRVRIVSAQKRYVEAELVEILKPSPERIAPPCHVFGRCGGCSWQHIPYELQWKTKVRGVKHALDRLQVSIPKEIVEFPSPEPFAYRNRIQLRGFQSQIGFYEAQSNTLVPIESCPVARPEINSKISQIRSEGARFKQPYKVEVEVASPGEVSEGGAVRWTWNSPHAASGFRQVHDSQNLKLRAWILEQLTPARVLYDLFGGNGNLSLPAVSHMKEIHCVDLSVPTPETSDVTASHYFFHKASVLTWLLKRQGAIKKQSQNANQMPPASAILDPPRAGLGERLHEIAGALEKLGVHEVIAVGCDPDAWVRDLSQWIRREWILEKIALFDFFPQTPHIESVALLRKKQVL